MSLLSSKIAAGPNEIFYRDHEGRTDEAVRELRKGWIFATHLPTAVPRLRLYACSTITRPIRDRRRARRSQKTSG